MAAKPKRKKCPRGCGLIAIEHFADHVYLHEAQTELVPLAHYTKPLEPTRTRRKMRVHNGGPA